METSLIVCTYQRPKALLALLESVKLQTRYPGQIIVVDASKDDATQKLLEQHYFQNLEFYKVGEEDRGLTRQRNFGVKKISPGIAVVFFLDDDTRLSPGYFEEILKTYAEHPEALGVSGYITNETVWKKIGKEYKPAKAEFIYDGWARAEGSRFSLRRKFNLAPNVPPGFMPDFSHGHSTGFLPPTGKTYKVEMLMGGIASYKKEVFKNLKFSPYFEGYGLYEDADFSLRVSKLGKLFVNTSAGVAHYHATEGRPNRFRYGKMVVRNGWYVWRVKNARPSNKATFKWHATSLLLILVRMGNTLNTNKKKEALTESLGRIVGWFELLLRKPRF